MDPRRERFLSRLEMFLEDEPADRFVLQKEGCTLRHEERDLELMVMATGWVDLISPESFHLPEPWARRIWEVANPLFEELQNRELEAFFPEEEAAGLDERAVPPAPGAPLGAPRNLEAPEEVEEETRALCRLFAAQEEPLRRKLGAFALLFWAAPRGAQADALDAELQGNYWDSNAEAPDFERACYMLEVDPSAFRVLWRRS